MKHFSFLSATALTFRVAIFAAFSILALTAACTAFENKTPEIIVSPSEPISFKKGEYIIEYTIENPVSGAIVKAGTTEEWLEIANCDETGKIILSVSANTEQENRSAIITIEYIYGKKTVRNEFNLIQLANGYDYMSIDCEVAEVIYLGKEFRPKYESYRLRLISKAPKNDVYLYDTGVYNLVLYSDIASTSNNIVLPDGTYILGISGVDKIDGQYATVGYVNAEGSAWDFNNRILKEGTLTVRNADKKVSIEGDFTDAKGQMHYVTFNGRISAQDGRQEIQ